MCIDIAQHWTRHLSLGLVVILCGLSGNTCSPSKTKGELMLVAGALVSVFNNSPQALLMYCEGWKHLPYINSRSPGAKLSKPFVGVNPQVYSHFCWVRGLVSLISLGITCCWPIIKLRNVDTHGRLVLIIFVWQLILLYALSPTKINVRWKEANWETPYLLVLTVK